MNLCLPLNIAVPKSFCPGACAKTLFIDSKIQDSKNFIIHLKTY